MDITIQHPWFRRAHSPFYPSRLLDQFFGEGFFEYDLFPFFSSTISPFYRQSFLRSFLDSGISEVRSEKDKFTVCLDVKHFSPDELSVKVIDNYVEIRGKHSERQDEHGYVSRSFHRRYRLAPNVDPSTFTCCVSPDGMLTLCAQKSQSTTDFSRGEKTIPVIHEEKTSSPSS
ncbi:alpha-crystallin A chain [Protopterus annectens]|uniref:alpha-crystallin A chain n=1 Tax=Protopterus annectens TaxID=7888 RepID=UPI001CF9D907|nr:alpha-crystallin A chain [Protopterus annectens]